MNIKELIKKRMQSKGISAYRLAQLTGITQGALSVWFNSDKDMKFRNLEKIFVALDIELTLKLK